MNVSIVQKSLQNELFPISVKNKHLLTITEASIWASNHLGKNVTTSNISYLIQYGRVQKFEKEGIIFVSVVELNDYYKSYNGSRKVVYKERLGNNLNWALSFDQYKEAETTKHVHRLHPYKGKFIPQLVEYFLDDHTDSFKKKVYFNAKDIVLDPFSGSGTTMVQAAELGMNAIGIDISEFNSIIGNSKVKKYDINEIQAEVSRITSILLKFVEKSNIMQFEENLLSELSIFNEKYFPVPDYKYKLRRKEINEEKYAPEKEKLFLSIYYTLVEKFKVKTKQPKNNSFLDKWYFPQVRAEIELVYSEINKIANNDLRNIFFIMLSRTMRSCRATTHADLATLLEPVTKAYYCSKHGKMCKPLFSILKWWKTYTKDTVERLQYFSKLRTETEQLCLVGDSRTINIFNEANAVNQNFGKVLKKNKIAGIFSSPPYVGLIDYHEQHAYAYELFKFTRNDELEIGPLFRGKGIAARNSYIEGVSSVLLNCKKYFVDDYNVFLVANDKFNMYPTIAEKSGMTIVQQFHRPVLNRTERDQAAYSETIFHMKDRS